MATDVIIQRGVVLNVPYSEKEQAKSLGARWDPQIRKWFVPRGVDPKLFSRWLEEARDEQ